MNYAAVRNAAPATPPCFSSREAWIGYLFTAQECGKQRPFFNGEYRNVFGFCNDCTQVHSLAMTQQGKCNPSIHRGVSK